MVPPVFPLHPLLDTGAAALVTDGLLLGSLVAYLAAVVALARRGRRWPIRWTAAFAGGLVALFLAIGSGIGARDDTDVAAHVAQHLLLMMVGAPLLVMGRVPVLAARAGPRGVQRRIARVLRHRLLRRPTGPGLWLAYFGLMWACFLPPLYRLEVGESPVHDALHAALVLTGVLFWQGVVGPGWSWRRVGVLRRSLPVVAGMPVEAALGAYLVTLPAPLAGSGLVATHAAAQVFWIGAMVTSGTALAAAVWHWALSEERAAVRAEAALCSGGG